MSTVKFLDNLKLSNNEMKVISGLERAGFFECAEAIYIEHPCRLFRNDHNVKYVKGCNIQEVIGLAFWMTTETGMDDHRKDEHLKILKHVVIEFEDKDSIDVKNIYISTVVDSRNRDFDISRYSKDAIKMATGLIKTVDSDDFKRVGFFIRSLLHELFYEEFGGKESMFSIPEISKNDSQLLRQKYQNSTSI